MDISEFHSNTQCRISREEPLTPIELDPFGHFDTIPVCDKLRVIANSALSRQRAGKK